MTLTDITRTKLKSKDEVNRELDRALGHGSVRRFVRWCGAVVRRLERRASQCLRSHKQAKTPDADCGNDGGNARDEGQRRHDAGIASCPPPNVRVSESGGEKAKI